MQARLFHNDLIKADRIGLDKVNAMTQYRLIFYSMKQADALESVSALVAALLQRRQHEIYAMLVMPGLILINGLSQAEAETVQNELIENGCLCIVEPEDGQLASRSHRMALASVLDRSLECRADA